MGSHKFAKSVFLAVALITAACTTAAPAPPPTSAPQPTQAPQATAVPPTETAVPATATTAATTAATAEPAATAAPAGRQVVVASDGMIEPYSLFTDASGNCTKKVTMSFMEHGDWLDPNVDQRYGMGLLIQRWQKAQKCVELKIVPVPPGDAPGMAASQLIAGTPNDIFSTHPTTKWYDDKLVIELDSYLNAKNPYSNNATWYEDFPYADLTETPYADGHYYNVALGIHTGAVAPDGIVYNADLLKAAGVDVATEIPPKTMTDFFNIMKKVKASGKIPFWLSLAGDTRWEIDWYGRFLMDQLMPDVAAAENNAIDEANRNKWGTLSEMMTTYGVITGTFKATDPRVGEYFRIIKEWSQYFEPGYAAPPELVAETASEFLKGNVAFTTIGSWRVATIEQYPNRGFAWGTFFMPPIDKAFSKFATGEPIRRHGGNGQPAGAQLVPAYIPAQTAKDPDKLAAAIDLLQYITAPQSITFYCSKLIIPCYQPGATLDEIFKGDKVKEQQLRAFFDPAPIDIPVLGVYHNFYSMQGGSDEVTRLMVEYLQGNITLEVLQQRVQDGLIKGAKSACAAKLKDKAVGWDWCAAVK